MGQLLVMLDVLVGQLRMGGQLVAGHGRARLGSLVGNRLQGLGMVGLEASKLLAQAPALRNVSTRRPYHKYRRNNSCFYIQNHF